MIRKKLNLDSEHSRIIKRHIDLFRQKERLGQESDNALAKEFKVSPKTVRRMREALDVPPFTLSPRCDEYLKINRDKIVELYNDGLSDREIAAHLNCSYNTVANIRNKELKLRRTTQVMKRKE